MVSEFLEGVILMEKSGTKKGKHSKTMIKAEKRNQPQPSVEETIEEKKPGFALKLPFLRHFWGKKTRGVEVKRTLTPKFYMMVVSGVATVFGLVLFVLYFKTLNMVFGIPSVIITVSGIFAFRHYWQKEDNLSVEHIGKKTKDATVNINSLNLYPDRIEFANVENPQGFPMLCDNLKKKFYVNKWDKETDALIPFILPDQQYLDPIVFAQRVLGLPAHKKIFERKPKLLHRLKTAMLVLAIGIVWLLILTTTGVN